MKKIACILTALLLLVACSVTAFAAEDVFVPSISYKDGPTVEDSTVNDTSVTACLVVTSVLQAKEKKTDISQESRDALLDLYAKLESNTIKLPAEYEDLVVRELVDVSFLEDSCVSKDHGHEEDVEKPEISITVRFQMNMPANVDVAVLSYVDGQWKAAESVVNNGDGTVTCVLQDLGPVAFCVPRGTSDLPADTGDAMGRMLWLWALLLIGSMGVLVTLVLNRRKFMK